MNEMLHKKTAKNDQSGQAMIEYILILAISVALVLGLANQLYKPFGSWLQNYMGAYLECLIDIGELPSLGYEGGSGECNTKFQPGTLGAGRPPRAGSGGGNNSANKGAGSESGGGGSGGGSAGDRGGRSSAGSRGFPVGTNSGADGPGSGSGSKVLTEALPETRYFRMRSSAFAVSNETGRRSSTGVTGIISMEQEKIKKREQRAFTTARLDNSEGESQRGKKLIVKPGERKIAAEETAPAWGFSQYLKYFLILIIIIAIILFLGGQVLQISKSMEK